MSEFDKRLRQTVKAAYANAPAVKARFDKAGIAPKDIQSVADLVKVPILTKDEVVNKQQIDRPFGGMLGVPLNKVSHIFFSPGPIYEPAPEEDGHEWSVAINALRKAGFRAGDIVLNSFSYHLVPSGFMFDKSLTRMGCTVVPGGVGNSDLQLKLMQDLGVTGYVGTASFLYSLLEKAESMGLDVKKHLKIRKAFVSAEMLSKSMRQRLEEYGLKVGDGYGTAEFGLLAVSMGGRGAAKQLLPEPIVEIVNPETGQPVLSGETGEIVVTNFSKVYPLIRFGTGDMAMNIDPNPGRSKQEERAIILVGRTGEAIKVRGMFVHPNQLRMASIQLQGARISGVQGVISRQKQRDHFVVRLDAKGIKDKKAATNQLKQAVKDICRVTLDDVEFVAAGTIKPGVPGILDERTWD